MRQRLGTIAFILAVLAFQGQSRKYGAHLIARSLILEVGDAANQHVTARPCPTKATDFKDCYLTSSNAKDYLWGAPEIRYPVDGSPWGVHLTGPYPDGRSYLVSWFTGGPTIGPNQMQPDTRQLVTHAAVQALLLPSNDSAVAGGGGGAGAWVSFSGSIITYLRNYSDSTRAKFSYLSPYIHHVVLTNLTPSTAYNYRVSARNGSLVGNYSFTTLPIAAAAAAAGGGDSAGAVPPPPPSPYPLRVGIMGDVGQTRNSSETRDQMLSNQPQVVLHLGDNSYADNYDASSPDLLKSGGTNQQRWDSFNVLWERLFSKVPVLNVPGNHDVESSGIKSSIGLTTTSWSFPFNFPFQSYSARFPAPGSTTGTPFGNITAAMYYSTVFGGVAKLISINNYIAYQPGSPQYNFVVSELQKVDRSKTPWLLVMFHTSMYHTYYNHYKEMECFRSIYEKLFYQYGVDLVFNGHVHAYERTHPVYNYTRDTCGPIYVTVGDGGNLEGLYRQFVDEVSSTTGKTRCEGFRAGGLSPAQLFYTNPGGWSSAGPRPPGCPTLSFQPASGVAGGPPVVTLNNTSSSTSAAAAAGGAEPPLLGFCQSSQPVWSARRDPSFGHAILDLLSDTRARFRWFKNPVGTQDAIDDVVLERQTTCVNRRRRSSHHHRM